MGKPELINQIFGKIVHGTFLSLTVTWVLDSPLLESI